MAVIGSFRELRVYHAAFDAAMRLFELSSHFPIVEKYSMVDQMRRSSRSVCPISRRHGASADTRPTLLVNSAIQRAKQRKPVSGSNSLSGVVSLWYG
jgi:hypothetical protein